MARKISFKSLPKALKILIVILLLGLSVCIFIASINLIEENIDGYNYYPAMEIEDTDITHFAVRSDQIVGHHTFHNCHKLIQISFPADYKLINPEWFSQNDMLNSIDVAPDSNYDKSVDGIVYNKSMTELICFPKGKIQLENGEDSVFEIPSTVRRIGENAFLHNISLRKVTVHSSVRTIGEKGFYRSNIQEIVFNNGL